MGKQIRIYIKGGALQCVETNFHCTYQLIDFDNILEEYESIADYNVLAKPDRYQPDTVYKRVDIFNLPIEE